MPRLTIDGKEITVEQGTSVIKAAEQLGIYIPRFCYHPALPVAGNCRMCFVEIEKMPKPVISCQTECKDGMVILTNTEKVQDIRRSMLEFLLIHHPLDCLVCDQAGECDLQDFYMRYGLYEPRFDEEKNKKRKAVSLGKTVMLDSERCVLCSRCVRFTREITKTHELGIFNRGERSEVGVVPGGELDNPYSGNVVDICPVGALTDKDFRFKCRVWYLKTQESICPGCSRGCNIRIDYNLDRPHHGEGRRVMRLKPRENKHVNQEWMCDEGRYGYSFIDEDRILTPHIRKDNELKRVSWQEALQAASDSIEKQILPEKIGVIVSTHLTNEDLFAVKKLFTDSLKVPHVDHRLPVSEGEMDDFLRTADKSPNTKGASQIFDPKSLSADEIIKKVCEEEIKTLFVFGHDLEKVYDEEVCGKLANTLENLIFIGSNWNRTCEMADIVLPSAVYAEKEGTFTNCDGRVQRIRPIAPPVGTALGEWRILRKLAEKLDIELSFNSAEDLLVGLGKEVSIFSGLNFEVVGHEGAVLKTTGTAKTKGKRR